jgi:hypothetical protein
VYRVLDLVVDVVSCGERGTDARGVRGDGERGASWCVYYVCLGPLVFDRIVGSGTERRVCNWRIALCETAFRDTEQNGAHTHMTYKCTDETAWQPRAPRGQRPMRAERTRSTAPTRAGGGDWPAAPR